MQVLNFFLSLFYITNINIKRVTKLVNAPQLKINLVTWKLVDSIYSGRSDQQSGDLVIATLLSWSCFCRLCKSKITLKNIQNQLSFMDLTDVKILTHL